MTPKRVENTERVSTFLTTEHLERLRDEAKEKGQTVSSMIRLIILEYLAKK